MATIDILNLVRVLAGRAVRPGRLKGLRPDEALDIVRASCAERSGSLGEWCGAVLKNCVIAKGHPYLALLEKRGVPEGDPLRVLGAIAYGTQSPWIILQRIRWEDGAEYCPPILTLSPPS